MSAEAARTGSESCDHPDQASEDHASGTMAARAGGERRGRAGRAAGSDAADSWIARTCRELRDGVSGGDGPLSGESRPLREFRSVRAYVLLGEPGAGKTTEFERECKELADAAASRMLSAEASRESEREEHGDAALMISARDFVAFDLESHLEWRHKVLFIDGLDEMRAGGIDSRVPLDQIRNRLDRLRPPGFRISCREADWLGHNDRQSLAAVSRESEITVLKLDDLDAAGIIELLEKQHNLTDPRAFVDKARQHAVDGLLANPLTLHLLANAVKGGERWPASRRQTLKMACQQIATEHNDEHRIANRSAKATIETVLDAAGYLSALQLLSGIEGYTLPGNDVVGADDGGPATRPGVERDVPLSRCAAASFAALDEPVPPGAGVTRRQAASFVALDQIDEPPEGLSPGDLDYVLGTKLFRAAGQGRIPMHRHVAEFLAGRYLAKLIAKGLPARRVVALMTGVTDGRVVTPLRGLSAWLAAESQEARPLLIAADPVGVGLYGDIGHWSPGDKRRLLESLAEFSKEATLEGHQRQDGRGFGFRDDTAWAFRSLATADMLPAMKQLLSGPDATEAASRRRSDAGDIPARRPNGASAKDTADRIVALVLSVLSHAVDPQSVADLEDHLKPILWSETHSSWIRGRALAAYLHIVADSEDRREVLKWLLDAIQDGSLPDPDDEMRGDLLHVLYPEVVTPSKLWSYATRHYREIGGSFWSFWNRTLLEESSEENIAELLDSLYADVSGISSVLRQFDWRGLPTELLERYLKISNDPQDTERLANWLVVSGDSRRQHQFDSESVRFVRSWLQARPQIQKRVVLNWIRQHDPDEYLPPVGFGFCEALHGLTLPPDFGLWCLEQAIQIGDHEPEVSRGLLWQALRSLNSAWISEGLTLEAMRERITSHPILAHCLDKYCERRAANISAGDDEHKRRIVRLREQWDEEQRRISEDWEKHLREHEPELRANRFSPHNLSTLADVYLGRAEDVDPDLSPRNRISRVIGRDPRLVDGVMIALRDAVLRDDLPEVDQTVLWSLESRRPWLAAPVLASLQLLDEQDPQRLDELVEIQKRKALAIYYCVARSAVGPVQRRTSLEVDQESGPAQAEAVDSLNWHQRWLEDNPEMVLDVLFRCAVSAVRAGKRWQRGLDDLNAAEGVDDQAHDVRLRLLAAFPTRSTNEQLGLLDDLLIRALDHPDKEPLRVLAEHKQGLKSMAVAQRVRWSATKALIDQGTRLQQLRADLAGRKSRIRHFAEFLRALHNRHDIRMSILTEIRDPLALGELIEILGGLCPAPLRESGFVTLEMHVSDLISRLIWQLGTQPGDEAEQTLARLAEDPALEGWHRHLLHALGGQRVVHRDASYSAPNIKQVQDTLKNGPPSNPADLKALLADRLKDMCDDLRGGNADLWRQFWNEEQHRLTGPKPEDSCRDALLANLQCRLPDNVDAAREGSYAANTRSDIRVSSGKFNVPIEIKKDSHPDLWRAMRDQLMAQYTTDPATEGHGIYLVLWFAGPDKLATLNPQGVRPSSPNELQQQLEQDLTSDEARKISIIVMDVTKPGAVTQGT